MISKELLKEVTEHTSLEYDGYNIYELAHKCKEWALKYGAMIMSGTNGQEGHVYFLENVTKKWFTGNSELEAIIKACEWILNECKEV